jgi:hypothetical protein
MNLIGAHRREACATNIPNFVVKYTYNIVYGLDIAIGTTRLSTLDGI